MPSPESGTGEDTSISEPVVTRADVASADDASSIEPAIQDTRWDHDKAEDIAHSLLETKVWQEGSKRLDLTTREVTNPRSVKYNKDEADRLTREIAQLREDRAAEELGENDPVAIQSIDNRLIENRGYLNIVANGAEKRISHERGMLHHGADREIEKLEKVYNVNPEIFASMPTQEFFKIAKEFRRAEINLEGNDYAVERMRSSATIVEGYIQERKSFSSGSIKPVEEILLQYGRLIADQDTGRLQQYDIGEELHAIYADTFDKSDHQIWNEILALNRGNCD